jgi:hypothetical protein
MGFIQILNLIPWDIINPNKKTTIILDVFRSILVKLLSFGLLERPSPPLKHKE